MITDAVLLTSVISTPGARFGTADITAFYYGTPMERYEYMRIKYDEIPQNIVDAYNLKPLVHDGHIYMEIDPVYARLDPDRGAGANQGPQSDLQLSDVSDDDLRRSSDISRQSSNRYAEERPLIRNTLRKSAPHARPGPGTVRTVSAGLGNSLRMNTKSRANVLPGPGGQHPGFSRRDTPITIALSPGGEQFVSMNLEQPRPGQQPVYQHQPPQRGYHQHSLQ